MSVVVKDNYRPFDKAALKAMIESCGGNPPPEPQCPPSFRTSCPSCQCCPLPKHIAPRTTIHDSFSNEGKQEIAVVLPCETCTPSATTVYINCPLQGQIPPCPSPQFFPKHVPAPNNPMIQGGLVYCGMNKVVPVIPHTFCQLTPVKPPDLPGMTVYTSP